MKIDQGLFKLEFSDHHAVLGLPINTDTKEARKRYLKIARRLHPDSFTTASEPEKKQASEILSKLVNPAYETLSQEKAASEHILILRMKGQQLGRQPELLQAVSSEAARKLVTANNLDHAYRTAVVALAEIQYDNLDQVAAAIGQISEMNLVYLIRTSGVAAPQPAPPSPLSTTSSASRPPSAPVPAPTPAAPASAPRRYRETILESYLNRARELEQKQDFPKAILELREALRAFPNSAVCHSQLANVYLRAGQTTMARIHANRALEIDSTNEVAQRIQKQLGGAAQPPQKGREARPGEPPKGKSRGGIFGLFGGKNK